jgi:hypothetical protein
MGRHLIHLLYGAWCLIAWLVVAYDAAVDGATDLTRAFREQGAWSERRAPLYKRVSGIIADDPALVDLLRSAPLEQQLPVLLLAVIHALLLDDPTVELARYYPNLTPEPLTEGLDAALKAFCVEHEQRIRQMVATRRTQTNEVARCSLFLPALGLIAAEVHGPLAHVDVGTSAGLNLQLDRFHYTYDPGGSVGEVSTVSLFCGTRGNVPLPAALPTFGAHIGLDIDPIDVHDDDAAHWLMACVWPDQADRFHRLQAAIELARQVSPTIIRGDAVTELRSTIEAAADKGHPVVTNSWVLNYLPIDAQRAYLQELDSIGDACDLSWVYAESPALVPGIATSHPTDALSDEQITVLTMVRWRGGQRFTRRLGTAHPHGAWLHWESTD